MPLFHLSPRAGVPLGSGGRSYGIIVPRQTSLAADAVLVLGVSWAARARIVAQGRDQDEPPVLAIWDETAAPRAVTMQTGTATIAQGAPLGTHPVEVDLSETPSERRQLAISYTPGSGAQPAWIRVELYPDAPHPEGCPCCR
jgi:hypothetical protein